MDIDPIVTKERGLDPNSGSEGTKQTAQNFLFAGKIV
jgi:hypothetical protein